MGRGTAAGTGVTSIAEQLRTAPAEPRPVAVTALCDPQRGTASVLSSVWLHVKLK